ncbi:MAG: SDR family NAD(P)-dependent oxidoreductase, partial [Clostridiales bacterium]|nr:SDR family NAD(P)-dependent oxidoreductase [Clostridiales bacterium]
MFDINAFSVKGKVALITGGSYGIDYAIAQALHGAGATVVFNDINQELVDRGRAAYKKDRIPTHGYVCDLTDEEAEQALVQQIEKDVGVIHILRN